MQALEQKTRPSGSPLTDRAAVIEPAPAAAHWIVCGSCAQPITTATERISVSGRHLHEFMNPEGQRFVALCQSCTTHLGWIYLAEVQLFYGLIWDRLAELSTPSAPPELPPIAQPPTVSPLHTTQTLCTADQFHCLVLL